MKAISKVEAEANLGRDRWFGHWHWEDIVAFHVLFVRNSICQTERASTDSPSSKRFHDERADGNEPFGQELCC